MQRCAYQRHVLDRMLVCPVLVAHTVLYPSSKVCRPVCSATDTQMAATSSATQTHSTERALSILDYWYAAALHMAGPNHHLLTCFDWCYTSTCPCCSTAVEVAKFICRVGLLRADYHGWDNVSMTLSSWWCIFDRFGEGHWTKPADYWPSDKNKLWWMAGPDVDKVIVSTVHDCLHW